MSAYRLGLLGDDRRARAIAARLAGGSPFAHGDFHLAGRAACGAWPEVATDPNVDAVYVGADTVDKANAVAGLLKAGKAVLTTLPLPGDASQLAGDGRTGLAPLLVTTDLRSTMGGRTALGLAAGGELGRLFSIYIATRWQARTDRGRYLDERLWEALDYACAVAGAMPERAYAVAGGASGGRTAVMFNLRFPGDVILTGEVCGLLPRRAPAADPEIEIEIAGAVAALRVEPYRESVVVVGRPVVPDAAIVRNWHADPVVDMLADFAALLANGKAECAIDSTALARATAAVTAVRQSLASGAAVRIGGC